MIVQRAVQFRSDGYDAADIENCKRRHRRVACRFHPNVPILERLIFPLIAID